MSLIRYRCNEHLLILRLYRKESQHLCLIDTHHLSHHFTHPLYLSGF